MEGLLPSEIARLVLGYLQEESCEEVAKSFLESSPLLSECLGLSRIGRKFSTKVQGYSLKNILEEYCALHTIVQDQLNKLPPGNEHLKQGSVVDQLKHLFGARCPVQVKITLNSQQNGQNTSNGDAENELVTSTPRVRNGRKSVSRFQNALDHTDSYPDLPLEALPAPDATPLESLPGNSDHGAIENTNTQALDSNSGHFRYPTENTLYNTNVNRVGTCFDNTSVANPPKDANPVGDRQFPLPPSGQTIPVPDASRSANLASTSGDMPSQSQSQSASSAMYPVPGQEQQYSSSLAPGPGLYVDSSRHFVCVAPDPPSEIPPRDPTAGSHFNFSDITNWKSAAPDCKLPCVVTDHCGSKLVLVGMENMNEHPLAALHYVPQSQVVSVPRSDLTEQVGKDLRFRPSFLAASSP